MIETAFVRCPVCDTAFAPAEQEDRSVLPALLLVRRYMCPTCGIESEYLNQDIWFELVTETG